MTAVAQYGPGAPVSTATQTASVTVAANELLILSCATGNGNWVPGTPSGGTGLTWTLRADPNSARVAGNAVLMVWTTVSPTAQTFTLSVTAAGSASSGKTWTWRVQRWANTALTGNFWSITNGGTAPSLTFTTSVANVALAMAVNDYNSVDGATRTYRTGAGAFTETYYGRDPVGVSLYAGYHADAGAAGSKTVGLTAPTGQLPAMVVVELTDAALDKLRLGSGTTGPRVGASPASKAYIGATQVWP